MLVVQLNYALARWKSALALIYLAGALFAGIVFGQQRAGGNAAAAAPGDIHMPLHPTPGPASR